MANFAESGDLARTRVPLLIPLAASSALGLVCLFLGSSLPVVLMFVAGVTVTFLPLHLIGRDVYAMVPILFSVRYLIAGAIFKVTYGQPLDSHLFDPVAAYGLTLLLMVSVTTIVLIARRWDPGRQLFPFRNDPQNLRRLALICFAVGIVCLVIIGMKDKDTGEASAGPIFIIADTLSTLLVLGLAAEATRSVQLSGGKRLVSPLLFAMVGLSVVAVIAMNQRAFLFEVVIGVALVGFMHRAISPRLVAAGLVFVIFFTTFLSPLTLYLRGQRAGGAVHFVSVAMDAGMRMLVDPEFRKVVVETVKYSQVSNFTEDTAYDYFGDRSNVANRLSFVALLDAVNNGARTRTPIGMPAVEKNLGAIMPGFAGFKKDGVSTGDWLAWRTGLLDPPHTMYIVYGMPMEGLATWGLAGFLLYPYIFMLPLLLVFSRLSSFRIVTPTSIFLFAMIQHSLIESTTDAFMNLILRGLPVIVVGLGGIYFVFFRDAAYRKSQRMARAALLGASHKLELRRILD